MYKRLIYLLLLVQVSCIDPYEVTVAEGPQILTIEGTITSAAGPHTVRLTRGATYGSVFEGLIRPVTGATVIVRDELGNVTYLSENLENRGDYQSPASFSAIVGRSYTLQIQLTDGKVYSSFPEKVNNVPPIRNLTYQSERIPVEGEINDASGVSFIVDIDDPAEENNFYFWRNSPATYVLETRPDLYVDRETMSPAPKDCCAVCYKSETTGNSSFFIANDDNFNGLSTRIKAGFILDDGLRFVNTYRVDLRQLSISAEAYRFLRLVKQQTEISGSVFDPPPANIRGNMISLDNPDEVVLGYFIAAGETSQRVYINGAELDFRQNVGIIADDCRQVEGSVFDPPVDWDPGA
ncbi:DUF4249 domain-containing protein [Algoriphagus chordae]|uniref:Uncharacterized protein DUF4249 n=1 Tax=Algoriphagus chordae TaxID=237019 RepID=A0A2W7RP68_9BACT|nr:DUF4249 domain-containing protein [Algoriphagus chordae]PZX52555.1 uncharacterized protein DUF4249 [Algoriphagus chordae]